MHKHKMIDCPFCGGEDVELIKFHTYITVGCMVCDYKIQLDNCSEADAVKFWNTRPAENRMMRKLEKIKSVVFDVMEDDE